MFLGLSRVLITNLPTVVARFSGLTAVASQTVFLLVIIVVAWLYKKTWRESFLASYFTIALAFAVFYATFPFLSFRITRFLTRSLFIGNYFPHPPSNTPFQPIIAFGQWAAISIVVCGFAATAVYIVQRSTSRLCAYTILTAMYSGFIWLIYVERMRNAVNVWHRGLAENVQQVPWLFASYVVDVIYLILFTTITFAVVLCSYRKGEVTTKLM